MMRRVYFLALLPLSFALLLPLAEVRGELAWLHGISIPDCLGKRCCDDYHAKPLPPVHGVKRFCCDDYCPKVLPPVLPVKHFCCDDYCPKLLPHVHCPPCTPLTCPPPRPHCRTSRGIAPPTGNPLVK